MKDKPRIPRKKFLNYSLDPAVAPDKAKAFSLALGFTKENCDDLISQIEKQAHIDKCREKGHSEYGIILEQIMRIEGANGKEANVCTGWILKDGESRMRMTSAYVTKKKVKPDA